MAPLGALARLVLLAGLVALAVGGCTWSATPGPFGGGPAAQGEDRTVAVYEAVVRELVTKDHTFGSADPGFEAVYILDGPVRGAADAFWPTREPRAPFSVQVKAGLVAALADLPPVRFVRTRAEALADVPAGQVRNRGVLVMLAPIVGDEKRAEVGANLWIGGKAAIWLTYVVRLRNEVWRVTGTTGPTVIA
jgi:hypothetical protein